MRWLIILAVFTKEHLIVNTSFSQRCEMETARKAVSSNAGRVNVTNQYPFPECNVFFRMFNHLIFSLRILKDGYKEWVLVRLLHPLWRFQSKKRYVGRAHINRNSNQSINPQIDCPSYFSFLSLFWFPSPYYLRWIKQISSERKNIPFSQV